MSVNGNGTNRLAKLKEALDIAQAESLLRVMESTRLIFGGGSAIDLVSEDPIHDDGEVWDEVGLRNHTLVRHRMLPRHFQDLLEAWRITRWLSQDNEFAIGCLQNRVAYSVGTGLSWRAVPRDEAPEEQTKELQLAIDEWIKESKWCEFEQETVWRCDRDGEAFLRFFEQPGQPMQVRFVRPEDIRSPEPREFRAMGLDADSNVDSFGIKFAGDGSDAEDIEGYWVAQGVFGDVTKFELVPAEEILHIKLNVDRESARGWPSLWSVRRNLARLSKLQRNMTYVAALQAAIALVRKHTTASENQVRSFISDKRDLLVQNQTTGNDTSFDHIKPGMVIDHGPEFSYEAPISSVEAEKYVEIIQSELRAVGTRFTMPEYIISGDASNSNFASAQVAESPFVKAMVRLGTFYGQAFKPVLLRALEGTPGLEEHKVEFVLPRVTVRNELQEAQKFQIENTVGVTSIRTWQEKVGLKPDQENKNLAEEREAKQQEAMENQKAMIDAGLAKDPTEPEPAPGVANGDEAQKPREDGDRPTGRDVTKEEQRLREALTRFLDSSNATQEIKVNVEGLANQNPDWIPRLIEMLDKQLGPREVRLEQAPISIHLPEQEPIVVNPAPPPNISVINQVEPTPVTIQNQVDNEINVPQQPAPVVNVEQPKPKPKKVKFTRNDDGSIKDAQIQEE